jgi:hypothetical protein
VGLAPDPVCGVAMAGPPSGPHLLVATVGCPAAAGRGGDLVAALRNRSGEAVGGAARLAESVAPADLAVAPWRSGGGYVVVYRGEGTEMLTARRLGPDAQPVGAVAIGAGRAPAAAGAAWGALVVAESGPGVVAFRLTEPATPVTATPVPVPTGTPGRPIGSVRLWLPRVARPAGR